MRMGRAGGRRGLRSIRFRLTAWHALALAAALALFGAGISTVLAYDLRRDLDDRLAADAMQVYLQVEQARDLREATRYLDLFALTGAATEIRDAGGGVVYASDTLGGRELAMPAAGVDDPFFLVTMADATLRGRYATVGIDGARLRVVAMTLTQGGVAIGEIRVAESLAELDGTLALLRRALLVAGSVALLAAIGGGWALAGRALRPVDRMRAEAAAIGSGCGPGAPLAARLEEPATGDELARLAATFNALLDRLEAAFASERRFIADASHELRTPLTAIRGNVDVLLRQERVAGDAGAAERVEALGEVQHEAARMARLLEDLLTLARAEAAAGAPASARGQEQVDLGTVAAQAARTAQALDRARPLEVAVDDAAGTLLVAGDADRLEQAMLILLDNAMRHSPPGAAVRLELAQERREGVIRVIDQGEGIAPEHLTRIFDRFYRADAARDRATGGTGLGLAIALAIAREHGGTIAARSTPGAGSTFTIRLPLA